MGKNSRNSKLTLYRKNKVLNEYASNVVRKVKFLRKVIKKILKITEEYS